MSSAPLPANEAQRLADLASYGVMDSLPEESYQDLVRIASSICGTPMALVTLIDEDRQWFKAKTGIDGDETPRDISFCAHAINDPDHVFVVNDARLDPRFADNPFVTGDPKVRFYAGAPLVTPSGSALGALCVVDDRPRELTPFQIEAMQGLSRQVVALLELRKAYRELRHHAEERGWYEEQLKQYQRELEQENLQLSRQSSTDVLTGLDNRRAFNAALDWRIERAVEGESLHLALIDIDHFKLINDLHGHQVGDETLAAVAGVLRAEAGSTATVARTGGEEFVLLLAAVDAAAAVRRCEHVREAVQLMATGVPATVSIGIAGYRRGDDGNALYLRADQALYAAKNGGRNRVVLADA